ncbi:FCD domain-containing protein [Gordonia amicalis]|uniref:FadR/GntR family transcriptional regulator n=1 Tax=Gordonia amicalis TaxID=89053 RepID=UPI0004047970|nr:FCD domain-containing protein [Gordonia amicalis]MCZ0911195.1 FCD domain-containing protein [Gordonia amicalis]MCZ4653016.1 FCD domain-containing protein [Gordonia amicalis]
MSQSTRGTTERHDEILAAIGRRIVSGAHPAGSVLTLDAICTDHGVSRTVAREVIKVLESMGLVESRRRVGITIQPRTRWSVFDPRLIRWRLDGADRSDFLTTLSELRRGFEPVAAALAAERADEEQCRILAAAVSDMSVHGRNGDLESYLLADKVFHRTLLEASGNEMFRSLADVVGEVLAGRTHHGMMPTSPNPAAIALHDDVARAIRLRDPKAAEASMREIITEAAAAVAPSPTRPLAASEAPPIAP